jgi:hypothetical protein
LTAITDAALLQQAGINGLEAPCKGDISDLQKYLETDEMGPFALVGKDCTTWGTTSEPNHRAADLISLMPHQKQDSFSKWFVEKAMRIFFACGGHLRRKPDKVSGIVSYKGTNLLRLTYYITSALASLLPVLSITILWLVKSMPARLGIIAAFNVLITMCLNSFTMASRAEVFAVTARYVSRNRTLPF